MAMVRYGIYSLLLVVCCCWYSGKIINSMLHDKRESMKIISTFLEIETGHGIAIHDLTP
jgi:hypothetical protein